MRFSANKLLTLLLSMAASWMVQVGALDRVSAEPLSIGRLPAYRTVKVKVRVKVKEDFPRTLTSISHGVIASSANGVTKTLAPLTSEIYYTPLTPSVEPLPPNGGITDPTPTFSGAADPNTTIEIYNGDTLIGNATTDVSGKWSFVPPQSLGYGRHTIKIRAINGRSLSSEFSAVYELVIDCPEGRFGANCEGRCPVSDAGTCGGHGECSDGLEGTGACACEAGYFDVACLLPSNTCAVNLADGIYTKGEWDDIAPSLVTNNKIKGEKLYWSSGSWRELRERKERFSLFPERWFAIRGTKSCLGYQDGKQVLHLLVDSKESLGSYTDTVTGREYRLGLGPLAEAAMPEKRTFLVVWKLMPAKGGSIHYLAATLEMESGAQFASKFFKAVRLYREVKKSNFAPREFLKQEFSGESEQFIADLGDILLPIQNTQLSSQEKDITAIELGVDLIKFQQLLGISTTSEMKMQVSTYGVFSGDSEAATLVRIDSSAQGTLSDFATKVGEGAPSIKVSQRAPSRVTLSCLTPEGVQPSRFLFTLRRLDAPGASTITRQRTSINARVLQGARYEARCSYRTKRGDTSPTSEGRTFRALIIK